MESTTFDKRLDLDKLDPVQLQCPRCNPSLGEIRFQFSDWAPSIEYYFPANVFEYMKPFHSPGTAERLAKIIRASQAIRMGENPVKQVMGLPTVELAWYQCVDDLPASTAIQFGNGAVIELVEPCQSYNVQSS